MARRTLTIVVAHHNENLEWLEGVAKDCIVYAKGSPPASNLNLTVHHLPNIGREGHTYLHHIITNYDHLADVTLFVQGRIDDHVAWSIHDMKAACMQLEERRLSLSPQRTSFRQSLFVSMSGVAFAGIYTNVWHHGLL
jgi:hypothetical protein